MKLQFLRQLTPRRYALPRGVYRSRRRVVGQWVYYAIQANGEMIGPYRARSYETDAEIVSMLRAELTVADPVRAVRHLSLVTDPATPSASVGSHAFRSWLLSASASSRRGLPDPAASR